MRTWLPHRIASALDRLARRASGIPVLGGLAGRIAAPHAVHASARRVPDWRVPDPPPALPSPSGLPALVPALRHGDCPACRAGPCQVPVVIGRGRRSQRGGYSGRDPLRISGSLPCRGRRGVLPDPGRERAATREGRLCRKGAGGAHGLGGDGRGPDRGWHGPHRPADHGSLRRSPSIASSPAIQTFPFQGS